MKEVPVVDIKITDLKIVSKGYNMLEELRHEADAPSSKQRFSIKKLSRSTDHQQQKYFMIKEFQTKRCYAKISIEDTFGQGGVQTLDGAAHHHRKIFYGSNDTGKNGRLSSYLR